MKKLVLVAVLFAPVMAFAQDINPQRDADITAINQKLDKCNSEAASTMDMNNCNDEAIRASDAILNKVYQQVVAQAKGLDKNQQTETLKRLVNAERSWIAFRDAECLSEAAADLGGTLEGVEYGDCIQHLTKERIVQLRSGL